MSVIGKKVGQLKQWTAEKTGKAEKTDVGDEFKTLENATEVKKEQLEKLVDATKLFLPNHYNKQWSIGEKVKNPAATLGQQMVTSGQMMPEESIYGKSLVKTGETFEKISSLQIDTETTIKQAFLEPMIKQIDEDIKEWQHQKKKLENRRLDYDAKSSKLKAAKGPKETLEAETNSAKAKFDESLEGTLQIMEKIVSDREEEDVHNLKTFVEAQREYYEKSFKAFEELSRALNELSGDKITRTKSSRFQRDQDSNVSSTSPSNTNATSNTTTTTTGSNSPSIPSSHPTPAPRPTSVVSNPALLPGVAPPKPQVRKTHTEKRIGKFDFEPENPDELGFKKGDVIIVLKKHDDGWWVGELNSKQGVFPSNYTSPHEESEI